VAHAAKVSRVLAPRNEDGAAALLKVRDGRPLCRPHTVRPAVAAAEGRQAKTLQSTPNAICVVYKYLKTKRRAFDPSAVPSASLSRREFLFG
jgi:hypothetical protein